MNTATPHRLPRRNRSMITAMFLVLLTALAGCAGSSSALDSGPPEEPGFLISYAAAAGRLEGLDPAETEEQLRDWARIGLAAHLEMDPARLRDATYDTLPVRDSGLADLAPQPSGPGRALYDGKGVLHLLVPQGDPHRARAVGLLLDQHRADAGADPQQVVVHDYTILPGPRAIAVTNGKPAPVADVKAAHGHVAMRVDQAAGLAEFLTKTRHLSGLEVREDGIWAEGWNWPDAPALITAEDVSVLQRGYAEPNGLLPGFSLDPVYAGSAADLRAVVPELDPAMAEAVAAGHRTPATDELRQGLWSAVMHGGPPPAGLPADPARLWALLAAMEGGPLYSQARYDGPLAGTEVGMTLFYADYQAKNWAKGVGDGVPAKAVPGFVPEVDAAIPGGFCPEDAGMIRSSGRLWFGQAESGFAFDTNRVSIGRQATRLFAKSDGDGGEVEAGYAFGRGLGWWDRHYQAVANYEPQFQRLEQIMRWSGALEWLVTEAGERLPESGTPAGVRFADWYAAHNELRERSEIDFVSPPSAATHEAVLTTPSKAYPYCGRTKVGGGVSLADLLHRQRDLPRPELPPEVSRAGLIDQGSTFDPATGTGKIRELSLGGNGAVESFRERTFTQPADGKAAVETTGSGRREASLGGQKLDADPNAVRQIKNEFSAAPGGITQRVGFQGNEFGTLQASKNGDLVSVGWRSGLVDRALRLLRSMRGAEPADGTLLSHQDPAGPIKYQAGDIDAPWLEISRELAGPSGELTFRLGTPQPGGRTEYAYARLRGPPDLGGPDQMLSITPVGEGRPARVVPVEPPRPGAPGIALATPDGKAFNVSRTITGWSVQKEALATGREFSAALVKFDVLERGKQEAVAAGDGYYRAYALDGSGVALVGADKVIVASNFHPWAVPALNAIVPGQPAPRFLVAGSEIRHVDAAPVTADPGRAQSMTAGDLGARETDFYLPESARPMYGVSNGPLLADSVPREDAVIVTPAEIPSRAGQGSWQPDVLVYRGVRWHRVSAGGGLPPGIRGSFQVPGFGSAQSSGPTSPPTPTGDGTAPPATPRVPILLVCPDTDPAVEGCEEP